MIARGVETLELRFGNMKGLYLLSTVVDVEAREERGRGLLTGLIQHLTKVVWSVAGGLGVLSDRLCNCSLQVCVRRILPGRVQQRRIRMLVANFFWRQQPKGVCDFCACSMDEFAYCCSTSACKACKRKQVWHLYTVQYIKHAITMIFFQVLDPSLRPHW